MPPGVVFDTEGDGLKPSKFYVLSYWDDGPKSLTDYPSMSRFLSETPILVGHNIARWDLVHLQRILGREIPKETLIVDTLFVSWYISPTKTRHGLEEYGEEFGVKKPYIEDWDNLSLDVYVNRCETDVRINQRLWEEQWSKLVKLYGGEEGAFHLLKYLAFKADCAREQERSRWKLDIEATTHNLKELYRVKEEKYDELKSSLPRVPITVTRSKPAKPYKADGTLSEAGRKWQILLRERGLPEHHEGPLEVITGYDEPNPGSHDQIKKWLFSLGWEPRTFKTNDKKQEVPQINRTKQDGGGLCPSILEMVEDHPELQALDKFFVVNHRIGILEGFLRDVDEEGFLAAEIAGLTNTLRFKHSKIVNLPKIDAAYGDLIRSVLVAREEMELCGADQSSLEDRIKQHYCFKYDPEYVKEMSIDDFDPHLDLALFAKAVTPEQVYAYKHGNHAIKPIRGIYKNGNYACQYGAFPPKLAKTCGISIKKATEVHKAYWDRNWSIKAVAQAQKIKVLGEEKWLWNPVAELYYSLRHEKDIFSTLVQGTGVYCFDLWIALVREDRPQLTAQFHDEIVLEVKKGYRKEIEEFLNEKEDMVNDILKLNRRLDIGVEFGNDYGAIH